MARTSTAIEMRSPRGISIYPKLNKPDTKFDPAGVYEVKLAMDGNDPQVQAFVRRLEKVRDDKFAELVKQLTAEKKAAKAKELKPGKVVTIEVNDETGDETGRVIFKAKMKATGVRKDGTTWTQKPAIFDAKGTELKNPPSIGGGSELKLSVAVDAFLMETSKEVGLSIRLKAAQVLKLVQFGARDFAGYGFEAEDGDEISDQDDTPPFDTDDSGSAEHDDL